MATEDSTSQPDDVDAYDAWREPLLTSLKDCGVQRAPRLAFLRYIIVILAYAFTISVGWGLTAIVREISRTASPQATFFLYVILFIFFVTVLARIRNHFLRSAWQSSARTAEDEISQLGSRRPIFYLRSFGLDRRIGRRSWLEMFLGVRPMASAEQRLTAILKKLGPVIAIGRPGEKLPRLGAARFYAADELWKDKVVDVVSASQLVVWATGVTEGLKWEISYLTENLKPRRLLLWCHPHLLGVSVAKREAEWRQFRETLGDIFPKPLPETLGDTRFIVFDVDWQPIPVRPQVSHPFSIRQNSALKQTLGLRQNVLGTEPTTKPVVSDRNTLSFGSLLGARGETFDWPLIGVFFVALAASRFLTGVVNGLFYRMQGYDNVSGGSSGVSDILYAATLTVAAVLAFRFIQGNWLPAVAVGGVMMVFDVLRTAISSGFAESTFASVLLGDLLSPFVTAFLIIGALVWCVQRVPRLFFAFLVAALFSMSLGGFLEEFTWDYVSQVSGISIEAAFYIAAETFQDDFRKLLLRTIAKAVLFALAYALLLKAVPLVDKQLQSPEKTGR